MEASKNNGGNIVCSENNIGDDDCDADESNISPIREEPMRE